MKPGILRHDFVLYEGRVQNAVDDFARRIEQFIEERIAAGDTRSQVEREIDADLNNRGPLYRRFFGDVGGAIDFGANRTFQRHANPAPETGKGKFKWTLDPAAEHCDSCVWQSNQPPRPFGEIPLPTEQPTHGETNCGAYCKCQIEEVTE